MKILITGASSGIGRATALLLARKGHKVFMTARREDRLRQLAAESATVVGEFLVDRLDVADPYDIKRFCEKNAEWLKDLDVVVNNAGLALGKEPFFESKEEETLKVIQTNVLGLLNLTRALLPNFVERKSGHIVNLGSVAGDTPYKGGTVYCASKAAVHIITDALRLDLGGTGVRVSTIAPGRVAETEFSEIRFRGDKAKAAANYEGYRTMSSEDVAEAIAWVLERPEHVNIQELVLLSTDQPSATTLDPLKL